MSSANVFFDEDPMETSKDFFLYNEFMKDEEDEESDAEENDGLLDFSESSEDMLEEFSSQASSLADRMRDAGSDPARFPSFCPKYGMLLPSWMMIPSLMSLFPHWKPSIAGFLPMATCALPNYPVLQVTWIWLACSPAHKVNFYFEHFR